MNKQETLPGFEFVPVFEGESYPNRVIFFYLVSANGEQCICVDGSGYYYKQQHDLQHVIPHLFNSHQQAKKIAKIEGFSGFKATRYPYEHGWWKE